MEQGGRYPQVVLGVVGLIGSGSALWTLLSDYSLTILVFGVGTALGSVLLIWVGAKRYRIPKPAWWFTLPLTVVLLLSSLGYTRRHVCCMYGYTHESGYPDGYWNRFGSDDSLSGAKEAADAAGGQVDPFALVVDLAFWWYLLVFGTVSAVMVYRAGQRRRVRERHVAGL
ncbi:hypothetical protein ACWDYH_35830 [Nocardia goodfellowii]